MKSIQDVHKTLFMCYFLLSFVFFFHIIMITKLSQKMSQIIHLNCKKKKNLKNDNNADIGNQEIITLEFLMFYCNILIVYLIIVWVNLIC